MKRKDLMNEIEETLNIAQNPDYISQINARTKIVEILTKVELRQAYSDKLLDKELKEFDETDRRFITEVVNGVLRWRLRLDWYLNQLYLGEYDNLIPEVKNDLRSSVYQLVYLDKIPPYAVLYEAVEIAKAKFNQKTANLVNAILRNFLRQQKKFEVMETQLDVLDRFSFKYSHPKWLVQRWIEYWGIDEVSLLCEANNARPRLSVRINELITDREILLKLLDENGVKYEVHPVLENFLWIDNFQELRKLDFLSKGWITVQDVSTAFPVLALQPKSDEIILDMCAAPGGKTTFIAEKMQNKGRILALDLHLSRIKIVHENMQRMNFSNYFAMVADGNQIPSGMQFDKILIDAPCSGFGVLNKRVDLKWKRTEQDIRNMKKIQLNLLTSAAQALKPSGIIVYSTCTIEPEENEKVVEEFLAENKGFRQDSLKGIIPENYLGNNYYVQTFPHRHRMDGSFVARIRRVVK
jgi:16S rRNA (cytosine967-C5)-methyltransferase